MRTDEKFCEISHRLKCFPSSSLPHLRSTFSGSVVFRACPQRELLGGGLGEGYEGKGGFVGGDFSAEMLLLFFVMRIKGM